MAWRAYLKGDQFDLDLVEEQFDRGQVVVRSDGDECWMESPDFEGLTDSADVQRVARDLLLQMNGAAALVDASYRTVELTDSFSDGAGHKFFQASGAVRIRTTLGASAEAHGPDGELVPAAPPPPTLGPHYLALAHRDPNVQEALQLLGQGPGNWGTLHKVYEIIDRDGDKRKWAPMAAYDAFAASANSALVSGPDARHSLAYSRRSPKPPKHTMNIRDARAFIRKVASAWVSSK
jgi:hypothetical protein